MRVVVVAAESGRRSPFTNRLLHRLLADKDVTQVLLLSPPTRRGGDPDLSHERLESRSVGVGDDLTEHLRFADAVVLPGWSGGDPTAVPAQGWAASVSTVCQAAAAAGVPTLVVGSSALAYAPAADRGPVAEDWPTTGLDGSAASEQLAAAEQALDDFQLAHEVVRMVRLRAALLVDPDGDPVRPRRSLTGHLLSRLLGGAPGTAFPGGLQLLHPEDLTTAYLLALRRPVAGPFNLGAEPLALEEPTTRPGAPGLADAVAGRFAAAAGPPPAPVSAEALALARRSPILDTTRARHELGWEAAHSSASIVEAWATSARAPAAPAPAVAPAIPDLWSLYRQALLYFGGCAAATDSARWDEIEVWPGWSARRLVALAARDQYRVAHLLEGRSLLDAASGLPEDPLGYNRIDGWDLATERVRLALDVWRDGGCAGATGDLGQLVTAAVTDLVVWAWFLSRLDEGAPALPPDLLGFMRQRAVALGLDTSSRGTPTAEAGPELLLSEFVRELPYPAPEHEGAEPRSID
jgi:UDP-glucose 4-epimerase